MKEQGNLTVDERDAEKAQIIQEELVNNYQLGNSAEELINAVDDRLPELPNERGIPFTEFIENTKNKFMEQVQLKFKKLNYVEGVDENNTPIIKESNGVLPVKAHATDAGYDLTATRLTQELDEANKVILVYHTDVAVEIPRGYVGLLMMRSSVAKRSMMLTNCVGVIDEGYRGELMMKFKLTTDALPRVYQIGEKIGQLVIVPCFHGEPVFVDELSNTDRGEGGYGSTGNTVEDKGTDLILEPEKLQHNEHNTGESTTGNSEVSGDNR